MRTLEELGISPAPWRVTRGIDNNYKSILDANGVFVGNIESHDRLPKGKMLANARFIKAAPKVYEALNGLVDFIDRECIPCGENACELMTIAHDALAAAAAPATAPATATVD